MQTEKVIEKQGIEPAAFDTESMPADIRGASVEQIHDACLSLINKLEQFSISKELIEELTKSFNTPLPEGNIRYYSSLMNKDLAEFLAVFGIFTADKEESSYTNKLSAIGKIYLFRELCRSDRLLVMRLLQEEPQQEITKYQGLKDFYMRIIFNSTAAPSSSLDREFRNYNSQAETAILAGITEPLLEFSTDTLKDRLIRLVSFLHGIISPVPHSIKDLSECYIPSDVVKFLLAAQKEYEAARTKAEEKELRAIQAEKELALREKEIELRTAELKAAEASTRKALLDFQTQEAQMKQQVEHKIEQEKTEQLRMKLELEQLGLSDDNRASKSVAPAIRGANKDLLPKQTRGHLDDSFMSTSNARLELEETGEKETTIESRKNRDLEWSLNKPEEYREYQKKWKEAALHCSRNARQPFCILVSESEMKYLLQKANCAAGWFTKSVKSEQGMYQLTIPKGCIVYCEQGWGESYFVLDGQSREIFMERGDKHDVRIFNFFMNKLQNYNGSFVQRVPYIDS